MKWIFLKLGVAFSTQVLLNSYFYSILFKRKKLPSGSAKVHISDELWLVKGLFIIWMDGIKYRKAVK